jgi:hypothetical protein
MSSNGDSSRCRDTSAVRARARAARRRAEVLRDLAFEAEIEAVIALVRTERLVEVSPFVEARLQSLLDPVPTAP